MVRCMNASSASNRMSDVKKRDMSSIYTRKSKFQSSIGDFEIDWILKCVWELALILEVHLRSQLGIQKNTPAELFAFNLSKSLISNATSTLKSPYTCIIFSKKLYRPLSNAFAKFIMAACTHLTWSLLIYIHCVVVSTSVCFHALHDLTFNPMHPQLY